MGYIFEKQHVERFEIEKVKRDFMKYRAFSNVRKDVPNCELCDKEFVSEDNTNLAFVKTAKNKLICDTCASEVISKGVKEISW